VSEPAARNTDLQPDEQPAALRPVPAGAAAETWPPDHPDPGSRGTVAWRLGLGAAGVTALLVLLGLLVTHLSAGSRLALDDLTVFGSGSANTQTAIAVTVVAGLLLRWWLGRWYESWVVVAAIVGELLIFLVVTAVVHRPRPPVRLMDVAPPTSSYPSGHTGAAVALYGCLAVIVLRYARPRQLAVVVAIMLWLVPVAVAGSRLYRGMHFPTDVLAGALGGGLWLLVVLATLLPRVDRAGQTSGLEVSASGTPPS
jgi:undecaprenyl-diphosphatase